MKIGITQRVLFHKGRAYDSLEHSWYDYFSEHTLIPIANQLPVTIHGLDALIITGGDNHPIRNHVEHELASDMFIHNRPVIGICHGCQLLVEKLGGQIEPIDEHMDTEHTVIHLGQQHWVNSYHSLRIKQLPEGAIPLAYDRDGNAEAWIHGRTAGIMWHPERMDNPWIPPEVTHLLRS